jgi:hypothetical protein
MCKGWPPMHDLAPFVGTLAPFQSPRVAVSCRMTATTRGSVDRKGAPSAAEMECEARESREAGTAPRLAPPSPTRSALEQAATVGEGGYSLERAIAFGQIADVLRGQLDEAPCASVSRSNSPSTRLSATSGGAPYPRQIPGAAGCQRRRHLCDPQTSARRRRAQRRLPGALAGQAEEANGTGVASSSSAPGASDSNEDDPAGPTTSPVRGRAAAAPARPRRRRRVAAGLVCASRFVEDTMRPGRRYRPPDAKYS